MDYRFYVKRAVGPGWLDTNAQFADAVMSDNLSAPGILTARIPAGLKGGDRAEDGRFIYGRWDTVVIAESADRRYRWSGVCVNAAPNDDGGTGLMFIGATGWWQKVPYLRHYQTWRKDAARVLDDLFAGAMEDAPSKLPLILNTPNDGLNRTVGDENPPPKPKEPVREAGETMEDFQDREDYKAYEKALEEWEKQYSDNEQYSLAWWEAPYLGEEVDALANELGFEYRERTEWRDRTNLDFRMHVDVAVELRNRRHDIMFEDGVNIALPLKVRDDEQVFANHIIGLGAGEGRDMVRAEARSSNNRLYQAEYLSAKDVRDHGRLKGLVENQLSLYSGDAAQVDGVTVWDSPGYASVGTLHPGDEVFVKSRFTTPSVNIWRRITKVERRPHSSTLVLGLERANG